MKKDFTVFIMGADTPTGLTTGRSLFKLPVKVIGLYEKSDSATLTSKCWNEVINVSGSTAEQFRKAVSIQKKLGGDHKPLLLFTSDEQVIGYWEYGEALDEYFIVPVSRYKNSHFLMDKSRFHEWAASNQVLVPNALILNEFEDLKLVENFNEFPCVLKPMVRKKEWNKFYPNKKLFKFESYFEFRNFSETCNIFEFSHSYVLQKWIKGGDGDVFFVLYVHDLAGNILGRIGGKKHLQWPVGEGSTAICDICEDSSLLEAGDKVFQKLEVVGLNSIEFKKDAYDGKFYVIEPTVGRNDYQSGLSMLYEPNLTRLLVESVFGLNEERHQVGVPARKGLWIDDNVLLQHLRSGNFSVLKDIAKLIIKNKFNVMFLIFSLRDLGPIKKFLQSKLRKKRIF